MPIGVRFGISLGLVLAGTGVSVSGQLVGLGLGGAPESLARSVSGDGRYAFGHVGAPATPTPVRWSLTATPPVFETLEVGDGVHRRAASGSADGRVAILGGSGDPLLWREGAGVSTFASLSQWSSIAVVAMAPNGTAYGWGAVSGGRYRLARWVTPDAPEELPLPEGAISAAWTEVDGAGRLYFMATFEDDYRLCRMTDGVIEPLAQVERWPELHVLSHDGTTVGGARFGIRDVQNWAWSESEGFAPIVTTAPYVSRLTAITPDGGVIFGWFLEGSTYLSFAWRRDAGMISADQYFSDQGVDLNGWSGLEIHDVSAEGTRYVGRGLNPQGAYEAVLVVVESCDADFNSDDAVNSQDFFDFLACFFAPGCGGADFNADGAVNSQDFFDFLGAFFTGC
jgi:hypothetical protein